MSTYERIEFSERARRVFAPGKACAAAVKMAAAKLATELGVSWGRAHELLKGRALPTVKEMDFIRIKDGAWCPVEKKAKPPLMERMHDKIENMVVAFHRLEAKADAFFERRRSKREARLSQKHITERLFDRA